jgi:hypothetical protein
VSDAYVWLAYLVTYGLLGGYVAVLVGRLRRHHRSG